MTNHTSVKPPRNLELEPNYRRRGNTKTRLPRLTSGIIYPRDMSFVFVAVLVTLEIDDALRPDCRAPLGSMKIHGAPSFSDLQGCRPLNCGTAGRHPTCSTVRFSFPLRMVWHGLQFLNLIPL